MEFLLFPKWRCLSNDRGIRDQWIDEQRTIYPLILKPFQRFLRQKCKSSAIHVPGTGTWWIESRPSGESGLANVQLRPCPLRWATLRHRVTPCPSWVINSTEYAPSSIQVVWKHAIHWYQCLQLPETISKIHKTDLKWAWGLSLESSPTSSSRQ